jgi:hypothetical protein
MKLTGRLATLLRRIDRADRFRSGDVIDRIMGRNFRVAGRPREVWLREMITRCEAALPRIESDADRVRVVQFSVQARETLRADADPVFREFLSVREQLNVANDHHVADPDRSEPVNRIIKLQRRLSALQSQLERATG